ncbi:MAG: PAS domain S-box protein [Pseudomonas profundi]|uniref:PAS domain-containing sensor histidine kinase n=1 Tax=Pseudomonas profundi TaxID=1981513 RepID=UPI003001F589
MDAAAWVLESDPQPAVVLDNDGCVQALNPAMRDLAGIGQPTEQLPPNFLHLARACLSQQRAIPEVEAQAADGRFLLWTFIPIAAVHLVLARGQDATERLRQQQDATVASRLYRLIIENTTDLISRHTPDGRFLDASPASWTLLGYWPEQLRGTSIQAMFHPLESERLLKRYRDELEQEGYLTATYRIRHQQGHYLWFETASRAIRETYTGRVVEMVSVSRDITERMRTEESNRRLQDELAHAARLATLGELASGIAHEMNQPLAAIMNYAGASQRYLAGLGHIDGRQEKVRQGLERIAGHADHASKVIKRLRAFLRKGPRKVQRINLAALAQDAIRLCAWEASQHQVHIAEQIPDGLPDVYVDPILLEQVMLNLLRNAIEANRENHPDSASLITLRLGVAAAKVEIEVVDEGPGATAEQLEKMFTPFYTSKADGLGLGLSMSRGIVEDFGGGLSAELADSGGLRLYCWLPAAENR